MNLIRYQLKRDRFENSSFMNVQNGYTSLHWACRQGHVKTAELLISSGAAIEAKNEVAISLVISAIFSFKVCDSLVEQLLLKLSSTSSTMSLKLLDTLKKAKMI